MGSPIIRIALCLLLTSFCVAAYGQPRQTVIVYPSRLLNAYFPEVSLGYLRAVKQNGYAVGGSLSYVLDAPHLYPALPGKPPRKAAGAGASLEVRKERSANEKGFSWALAAQLSYSALFTKRDFALVPTSQPGVATLGETRVTARRTELALGFIRRRAWANGFVVEFQVGAGVGRRGWHVPSGVELAPRQPDLFPRVEHGTRFLGDGNMDRWYLAPRLRLGFGFGW